MIELLDKALELLNIFNENGYEAFIVGGFVRDYILDKKSSDIDISTSATPKQINYLSNLIGAEVLDNNYGSVKISYKKCLFEITTYRIDIEYKNNRTPSKILYTNNLMMDLRRRDFTVNTLCMDKDGNIIDLLGAKQDIKKKIIKSVGSANKKFSEDSLRILRAIRFATELDFTLDEEIKDAIYNNKSSLLNLSFYRRKQELNKIFSSSNALKGILILKKYGLESFLEITLPDKIVKTSDPIGMWAQISFGNNYPFTKNEQGYLKDLRMILKKQIIDDIDLYKYGNYVCFIAADILNIDYVNIYNRYDNLPIKNKSDISISSKEIINILKIEDKSILKVIIKDLEEKIISRKLDNTSQSLTEYIIDTYKDNMV